MLLNKKVSEPNFVVYKSENMPNKYLKKYYGVLPILSYTIKTEEQENRIMNYCDNIIFDSYIPTIYKDSIK